MIRPPSHAELREVGAPLLEPSWDLRWGLVPQLLLLQGHWLTVGGYCQLAHLLLEGVHFHGGGGGLAVHLRQSPLLLRAERFVNAERGWNLIEFANPPPPQDTDSHFPLINMWWGAYVPLSS